MKPLLSVVIPTFKRPSQLKRAVSSALLAAPGDDVEVVVVPNGPDDSWKRVAHEFRENPRIRWHMLTLGHACAARNHGLAKASGKYVRFLDDDDYLYPEAAEQLMHIETHRAEACSAPLENIHPNESKGDLLNPPASNDYPSAAFLSIANSGFTQGSIFLRSFICDLRWREDVVLYDDYLWALNFAERGEVNWFKTTKPVCAYVQHDHNRLSRTRRSANNSRPLVSAILRLHEKLAATGRNSPERTHAAATALLTHAHSAFPSNPFFLSSTIKQAQDMAPTALPMQKIFRNHPWLSRKFLATEWAIMAPRYITRSYRRTTWWLGEVFTDQHTQA